MSEENSNPNLLSADFSCILSSHSAMCTFEDCEPSVHVASLPRDLKVEAKSYVICTMFQVTDESPLVKCLSENGYSRTVIDLIFEAKHFGSSRMTYLDETTEDQVKIPHAAVLDVGRLWIKMLLQSLLELLMPLVLLLPMMQRLVRSLLLLQLRLVLPILLLLSKTLLLPLLPSIPSLLQLATLLPRVLYHCFGRRCFSR